MPTTAEASQLFAMLAGKPITMKATPRPLQLTGPSALAVYIDDSGAPAAACACDIAAAAYLGAVLALVPANVAAAAHKDGRLPEALLENFSEIMNVAASLFNKDGGVHVRLGKVHLAPLTPEARTITAQKAHTDYDITVPGYGTGKLSFFVIS